MATSPAKPTLTLIPGRPTPEAMEKLYERLTGRQPTAAESARLRERLKKNKAK